MQARFATQRREFRRRYIKWTQLNVKSGSSNADLIELFERCTQDIQKHRNYERYKNDPRFLRIWVQYVSSGPRARPLASWYSLPAASFLI